MIEPVFLRSRPKSPYMASAPTALSFTFVFSFFYVDRSAPFAARVSVRSDVMMIVYPETVRSRK